MGSDRARISYDPTRGWRSVVAQQGRVTLEADVNEAVMLEQEQRRAEVLDIVGPTGTPDDGYAVTPVGGGDIAVGPGTLYLGGWRLTLDKPLLASAQPDWLDAPPQQLSGKDEAVLLRVTEQEVVAVEDQALREVALGGPDTAARTRLLQHVLRIPVGASSCDEAGAEIAKLLAGQGLSLDPHDLQLHSTARLQVGYVPPTPPPGPCDPPAEGGYLGADNQLIRVEVTAFDPGTGKGRLVWGYDNGSVLYRCAASGANAVKLASEPIDVEHQPRLGQAVELLRTRVALGHNNYIAAPQGIIGTLNATYQPDDRSLNLPAALPTDYATDKNGPLFLRLWEAERDFISGQAVVLDPTGLEVTVSMTAMPTLAGRPSWSFAVRPSTPVQVYPARYADAPQPPEGPRQWLCPLAVLADVREQVVVLDDCRVPFVPLTKLKNDGCCAVTVAPEQVGGGRRLQALIDKLAGQRAVIALRPGFYKLQAPLRLDSRHKGLTLEGCTDGQVVLEAAEDGPAFSTGLMVLQHVDEFTLRRIHLRLPLAPLGEAAAVLNRLQTHADAQAAQVSTFRSVGVMAIHCAQLRVEDCQFRYILPPQANLIAVGLYGRGESWGLKIRGCSFLHSDSYEHGTTGGRRVLIGYGLTPDQPSQRLAASVKADALLEDADIRDNRFSGLTLPVLVMARLGLIRCSDNRVRECAGGFNFYSSDLGVTLELTRRLIDSMQGGSRAAALSATLNLSLLSLAAELGSLIPRPAEPSAQASGPAYSANSEVMHLVSADFRKSADEVMERLGTHTEIKAGISKEEGVVREPPGAVKAPPASAQPAPPSNAAPPKPAPAPAAGNPPPTTSAPAPPAAAPAPTTTAAPLPTGAPAPPPPSSTVPAGSGQEQVVNGVRALTVEARLAGKLSRPVLHIRDNDIEAIGTVQRRPINQSATLEAARASAVVTPAGDPYLGVCVVLEQGDGAGTVMVHGNRVEMAGPVAPAVGVLWPEAAVVTGNLLRLDQVFLERLDTALVVVADPKLGHIDVMGNLVGGESLVRPDRNATGPTTNWDFLNQGR